MAKAAAVAGGDQEALWFGKFGTANGGPHLQDPEPLDRHASADALGNVGVNVQRALSSKSLSAHNQETLTRHLMSGLGFRV